MGQRGICPEPCWTSEEPHEEWEELYKGGEKKFYSETNQRRFEFCVWYFVTIKKVSSKFCMQRCLNSTIVRPTLLLSCLVHPLFLLDACFWNIYNLCIDAVNFSLYLCRLSLRHSARGRKNEALGRFCASAPNSVFYNLFRLFAIKQCL